MIVYGSTLSPFVRKVVAFAAEKGLALDVKSVQLGSSDAEFREASPLGKMPGFRDDDFCISDSTAIVTYLGAQYPAVPLIPDNPRARARAVWWDEFGDTVLFGCFSKMFVNRLVKPVLRKTPGDAAVADAAEQEEMPPILDWLETQVPDAGFLLEGRITLADVAVASPFVNLSHIGVSTMAWPKLSSYVDAILSRPSFAATVAGERAFIAKVRP